MGQFALEIAAYSLAFFEKFFDQKFPLPQLGCKSLKMPQIILCSQDTSWMLKCPVRMVTVVLRKLDLVVPPAFPIGGMESWRNFARPSVSVNFCWWSQF